MGTHLVNKGSITSGAATFNIQIETIDNSAIEWTSGARASTEEIPKLISESRTLSIGRETVATRGTTFDQIEVKYIYISVR
jgi:hypothetical protein